MRRGLVGEVLWIHEDSDPQPASRPYSRSWRASAFPALRSASRDVRLHSAFWQCLCACASLCCGASPLCPCCAPAASWLKHGEARTCVLGCVTAAPRLQTRECVPKCVLSLRGQMPCGPGVFAPRLRLVVASRTCAATKRGGCDCVLRATKVWTPEGGSRRLRPTSASRSGSTSGVAQSTSRPLPPVATTLTCPRRWLRSRGLPHRLACGLRRCSPKSPSSNRSDNAACSRRTKKAHYWMRTVWRLRVARALEEGPTPGRWPFRN